MKRLTPAAKALIAVARAAHRLCDNTDEGFGPLVDPDDYSRLCRALDKLDALPDPHEPLLLFAFTGPAKAEHILRHEA